MVKEIYFYYHPGIILLVMGVERYILTSSSYDDDVEIK